MQDKKWNARAAGKTTPSSNKSDIQSWLKTNKSTTTKGKTDGIGSWSKTNRRTQATEDTQTRKDGGPNDGNNAKLKKQVAEWREEQEKLGAERAPTTKGHH